MFWRQLFLLLPLAMLIHAESCETEVDKNCDSTHLDVKNGSKLQWPQWCEVYNGVLNLNSIDLDTADFSKLHKIKGSLSLINSNVFRMPSMPSLIEIESDGHYPGVIILNNMQLCDMRRFVNWDKEVKVTGNDKFPIFISGNPELDTINLPPIFHKPLSPISCEKRLAPNYNIHFAEEMSLSVTLATLIFSATIFLYPMSMGNANVYFVPGYHSSDIS